MLPYGIRSVWSRPLFASEGKVLGTFAILYRESRNLDTADLQLIENASHITGIPLASDEPRMFFRVVSLCSAVMAN